MDKSTVYGLVETHYTDKHDKLVSMVSRYLGSKPNAEDVVQEAYSRTLKYWKAYHPDQGFNTWFGTVLNNAIKDFFKKELLRGMNDDTPVEVASPSQAFQRIQVKELAEMIEGEEKHTANILRLFLLEGYNATEVGQCVPESPTNVRKIVQRFRAKLG